MAHDDAFDDVGGASKIFFMDTNLSSPVLITELDATRKLLNDSIDANDKDKFYLLNWKQQNEVSFFRKLCRLRGWTKAMLNGLQQLQPENYEKVELKMLENQGYESVSYTLAQEVCQDIEESLCSGLLARGLPDQEIRGVSDLFNHQSVTPYRVAYEQFSDMYGRAESRVKKSESTWTKGIIGGVTIWINPHYAIIHDGDTYFYSSANQILMLKDKIATRYMLLEHVLPLGLDEVLHTHLLSLFKWQDETLTYYGNQAYNILKAVEPMFKTRLSHLVDNIFGNDTAYTRMIAKMDEKEQKVRKLTGVYGKNQMEELRKLVEEVKGVRSIVEMFGCLKSCGHPVIDPCLGGLSAAEEAISPDQTSLADSQNLRNTFCHTILVSFVKQHGVWPRLIHMKPGTMLRKLNDKQERNLDYNSYPFDDWNTTEWTKILDFDYFPNFLELMDDKSISFYRSEKHLSWEFDKKPSSQRRLLLEVLNRKEVYIKAIIDRVSTGDIPWEWKIVSLYPKEREFKIDPRMFAMLVLEMRCFFTAIEANIAHGLFRYMPQQTMTKTKTQNQERFLAFTDPSKNTGDYTLFLEIDLTRWNLRWRQMVIHALGHDLNMMFGMPGTFTVTHKFFAECQIVVRVPGLKPEGIDQREPPITSLAWRDHLGGFEGLNQKLWTAATYAMVETALIPLLKDGTLSGYELVGQGDNQVVRVAIPSTGRERTDIIPEVRDKVNVALENSCSKVNQIVKPEENIESTSVLTYSKDVYVEGVEYPTSLKKHSRLFPVTSLDFPSVASNTRAILAGAVAGGENALYPLRSSLIGCYHAARYLHSASRGFCIHGNDFPKMSKEEIIAGLVLPSSIGGIAGLDFASFFYKGGSDPLGKEISGMRMLAEGKTTSGTMCSRALRALEERYGVEQDPDLTILIDNPYGLPLAKTTSPLSQVGRLSLEAFRPKVNNEEIRPLLADSVLQAEELLKSDLIKIEPFNPILLHELYNASGFGTVKLMRKMFIHTRTVQSIAQWVNPNITHTFLRADLNDTLAFKSWLKGLPSRGYSGRTSFQLTTLFRSYWGREVQGVNNHQPLDSVHLINSTRAPSSIKWSAHSRSDLLHTRGPLSGYVGTATREKRSEHGYKIVDTGAPSRSIMKLQLIRSQAYGDANFNELLDRISFTRSPVRLSDITGYLAKVIGGSLIHRLSSSVKMMYASYVGPLNFVTHIRVDTDSLGEISGSALNYPVMIQEHIVVAQAGAKLNHIHRGAQSGELLFEVDNLEPLPDAALKCEPPDFENASLPSSVLLYSDALSLTRTYDNVAQSIPHHAVVKSTEYEKIDSIFESFVGFFMSTLKDQNRAKQIADTRGHASIPAKFQADVAEVHAFGPSRVIQAIAHAIVLTSIRDTFRTTQLHPERWDESMFMAHNIAVCLKTCATYWNHPLFQAHKEYPMLRSSQLTYGRAEGRMVRLEAQVRRQISRIFSNFDHRFWRAKVPVFAGENQTQVSEALTISGAKAILRLRITGDPKVNLYSSLYSGYMRLPKNITLSSPGILDLIRLRFEGLARAIAKQGDHLLARSMTDAGNLKALSVYNDDIRTVMRHARSLKPDVRQSITTSLRGSIKNFINPNDHCQHCLPLAFPRHAVLWNRYKQRMHGGTTSAGYTWLPLLTAIKATSSALVVGNGNGGLADLIITAFKLDVIGIDLESDMPREAATLLNYLPVGIQQGNRSRFIQSDWSINSSGDWTDSSVRQKVLDTLPALTTIFIDATGPSPGDLAESCIDSMEHRLVSSVYCRIIGETAEVLEAYDKIRNIHETRMWVISRSWSEIEIILEISRSSLKLHQCNASPALVDLELTEEMHSVIPKRYGELLEAATKHTISWNGESLMESHWTMENLCKSLLNKKRSQQLKYLHRYNLMIGYAVTTALMSDDALQTVRDWISEDCIETELFTYQLNERTITHLIKYVARLSRFREVSPLFFS